MLCLDYCYVPLEEVSEKELLRVITSSGHNFSDGVVLASKTELLAQYNFLIGKEKHHYYPIRDLKLDNAKSFIKEGFEKRGDKWYPIYNDICDTRFRFLDEIHMQGVIYLTKHNRFNKTEICNWIEKKNQMWWNQFKTVNPRNLEKGNGTFIPQPKNMKLGY